MTTTIEVVTDFDGACPHGDAGLTRESEDRIVLRPGYRAEDGISEEAVGKGSRFSARLRNNGEHTLNVTVVADWELADRCTGHDLGYVKQPNWSEWRMIPGIRESESRIRYDLALQPGDTELGLYPEYNYGECAKFVRTLGAKGVKTEVIGQSREGRDMWMITFPSVNADARRFFFQVRDHAYETAGSYCTEGVVSFLMSTSDLAAYLRAKFQVFIVPMTNPDGVFNGMSRLTWERGADMNRVHTVEDAAHATLMTAMDKVRPDVHMNVHNWTSKFVDGLLANDGSIADNIQTHLPPDHAHYKRWRVQTTADFLQKIGADTCPPEHQSWKNYAKDNFGAVGVNFEFPWFGRTPQDMREQGRKSFVALALAAIEDRGW